MSIVVSVNSEAHSRNQPWSFKIDARDVNGGGGRELATHLLGGRVTKLTFDASVTTIAPVDLSPVCEAFHDSRIRLTTVTFEAYKMPRDEASCLATALDGIRNLEAFGFFMSSDLGENATRWLATQAARNSLKVLLLFGEENVGDAEWNRKTFDFEKFLKSVGELRQRQPFAFSTLMLPPSAVGQVSNILSSEMGKNVSFVVTTELKTKDAKLIVPLMRDPNLKKVHVTLPSGMNDAGVAQIRGTLMKASGGHVQIEVAVGREIGHKATPHKNMPWTGEQVDHPSSTHRSSKFPWDDPTHEVSSTDDSFEKEYARMTDYKNDGVTPFAKKHDGMKNYQEDGDDSTAATFKEQFAKMTDYRRESSTPSDRTSGRNWGDEGIPLRTTRSVSGKWGHTQEGSGLHSGGRMLDSSTGLVHSHLAQSVMHRAVGTVAADSDDEDDKPYEPRTDY